MDFDYSETIFDIFEVLKIIHDFLKRKLQTEPTFPFLRLPLLARNEVIRSLGHKDCINLALSSKKAAEKVSLARIKTLFAQIEICKAANINLMEEDVVLFIHQEWEEMEDSDIMKPEELVKWRNQSSNSVLENMTRVYNEMKNIFRFKRPISLIFSADYKEVTTVKEVLDDPMMQTWNFCLFEAETIDSEELKMILDLASYDREFICEAGTCPVDFRHENAFKFSDCEYEDARWVKIEDLYKLNNCHLVTLERTTFTQSEIKEFIKYWVNSEIDMFWCLDAKTDNAFDPNEILDGLTILHIEHSIECFTLAKRSEARRSNLLCFYNTKNRLLLTSWAPGEFGSGEGEEYDETTGNKEEIIELLMEKEQLELEVESADGENKRGILKRLKQLDIDIEDYGVFFVNGEATLRAPTLKRTGQDVNDR